MLTQRVGLATYVLIRASSNKPQAPSFKLRLKLQATSFKKRFDMKDNQGYSIRYALFQNSRGIDPQKAGGRSSWTSAYRAAARDPAAIGIGNAPLMELLNASRRDPESNCIVKMSGGDVTRNSQGYGFLFSKDSSLKRQAQTKKNSKPQAPSSKLQAPSHKLQAP